MRRQSNRSRTAPTAPTVGHGQLLKAINGLTGCTHLRFRIAAMYLAHAKPPDLRVFPNTETIAELVDCSNRSVELCRGWLEDNGAVVLEKGGGRGRSTTLDFAPLARTINSEARFAVSNNKQRSAEAETAKTEGETAKPASRVYEKDPSSRTHIKDRAGARATEDARAARDAKGVVNLPMLATIIANAGHSLEHVRDALHLNDGQCKTVMMLAERRKRSRP